MTTPPTPAGWYPDPDGSGGQRYWDGSAWTEHRAPAAPPLSEQPTSVVSIPPASTGHVGSHRRAEPGDEPEPTPPPAEPTPPPAAAEPPSFEIPTAEAPSAEAPSGEAPSDGPSEPGDNRKLILRFGVACAALLAVLVLAVIYALFLHKDNTIQIGAPGTSTSTAESTSKSASATSGGKSTQTESPTASGQATDGGLTFAVTNVETAPSVKYQDAPVVKTAQGEFLIVHMTVLNSGAEHTTFLGTLQKLKAGGSTYSIDDEATSYLDGAVADLNPGDTKDVAIAFDVPPGTTPDAIELHGDPISSGVDVPLS
jgi:hypothetical protein